MLRRLSAASFAVAGLALAVAVGAQPPAVPDAEQIAYDIQHLPLVNSLELSRDQIDRMLPVLEAAVAESERIEGEPTPQRQELLRVREALLRGESPEQAPAQKEGRAGVRAVKRGPMAEPLAADGRRLIVAAADRKRATPESQRLAGQLSEILTEDQMNALVRPWGRQARPERAGADVGETFILLRRLPAAAYAARREKLADSIAAGLQQPGTFQFEQVRGELTAGFDRVRGLTDEQFRDQREALTQEFVDKWGAMPPQADLKQARQPGRGDEDRDLAELEKLYACDDEQYRQRRGQLLKAALEHRLALDTETDPAQVREEVVEELDSMRRLLPWEFEEKKAELAESLLGRGGGPADLRAFAALNRLADPRMIALLRAKAEYL